MNHLKVLRAECGLSQRELAERSGLPLKTVWNIENSRTRPTARTLLALAIGLDCTVDEVLEAVSRRYERFW